MRAETPTGHGNIFAGAVCDVAATEEARALLAFAAGDKLPVRQVRVLLTRVLSLPGVRLAIAGARRPVSQINGPWAAAQLLLADWPEWTVETLHVLYLAPRGRLLARRCLTRGNDQHTVADPRQIFRLAVELGATGVIVAHNHPAGDPTPSEPDLEITRRLAAAGQVLGIALLDHIIVTHGGRYASLAELGQLPVWETQIGTVEE